MTTLTTASQKVQDLFGPMLIGVLLNTTLYGVLLVQMSMYYKHYKQDRKWFRYLAFYLLIAETANVVFDVGLIYEPLITRYGTAKAREVSPLLLRPDAAVTVAISTPIQLFVAWRIQVITHSYFFPIIIGLTSLISFAGGLSVTTMVTLHSNYSSFANLHPFVTTWLSASAACDVILSAALIYSLYTRKSGERSTDRYINRIIRLTVQTGSITAIAALLDLFIFLFSPGSTLQFVWDFPLSKLYSNALFSTLNSRPWTEEASKDTTNVLFERSPIEVRSMRIPSVVGYAHPALELHRRRGEPSPWATHHGSREDLEGGSHVLKFPPL
ncbi:hypothetical protein B0H19DRAFT_1366610 [Mycena capillaripes]|nr:hypothetical protein B0H19DRAFT_1366610 [Mycena capillaripes]